METFEKLFLLTAPVINRNSYSQVCKFYRALHPVIVVPRLNLFTRLLCKLYDVWNGLPPRNKSCTYHEACIELLLRLHRKPCLAHILVADEYCGLLTRTKHLRRASMKLVFSVHQPFKNWAAGDVQTLEALDGLITMCVSDAKLFAERLPGLPVRCIPHGVDVDYWKARPLPKAPKKRIGFCGKHLRNVDMFMRVAQRAMKMRQDVEFYCLIPPGGMNEKWTDFAKLPGVRILQNLSQDEVLGFYQGLYLLMMPLNDTTANNVIVESMSCSVPVLSTNVGGIATYGGGSVFPVVENNDDNALYEELCRFLDSPALCEQTGAACREFAETQLSWLKIAAIHEEFYKSL